MQFITVKLSPDKNRMLRGLAILAVLIIHFLAYLPNIYHSNYALFYIGLDQIGRFCVPLFVMLSGYGLAQKYSQQPFKFKQFFKRRIWKLLPPYMVWSLVSYFIFMSVPAWQPPHDAEPLLSQLLFGQVDYHLYFMVLIFQLYILFPLLFFLVKRRAHLVLLATSLIQLGLYLWYSGLIGAGSLPLKMMSDSNQYLFFGSWIAYFVFGIWLSFKALPSLFVKASPFIAVGFFVLTAAVASYFIDQGIDPLPALRSTRWPILFFATAVSITLMCFGHALPTVKIPFRINYFLRWIGKKSYLIFLAHTIALRIIFALFNQQVALPMLIIVCGVWLVTVVITDRYLLKE